jgi:hypothetical protein
MHAVITITLLRTATTAGLATVLLAGCGSATTSPTARPSTAHASATSSPAASANANPALTVALSAGELPSSLGSMSQVNDGLLGSTPDTDARVFATSDNATRAEVDLAVDTSATAASTDYTAYNSSAAKQVTTPSSSSTPSIGAQANEYVGTDTNGHNIVSIAFTQGSVLCVVTVVSTGSIDPTAIESLASAQQQKISAANL